MVNKQIFFGVHCHFFWERCLHLDKSMMAAFKYLKNAYDKTGSCA